MTSSIPETDSSGQRMIHTAGCIIIGDEVLGGKVHLTSCPQVIAYYIALID
jgi:hypothetical protein